MHGWIADTEQHVPEVRLGGIRSQGIHSSHAAIL